MTRSTYVRGATPDKLDHAVQSNCYFLGRKAEGRDGTQRCTKVITEGDYCFGCQQFICGNHDRNPDTVAGGHRPEDHLVEATP